jgi:catechol 2,3-dioxygenase-like lactoylglutathione lyase family enzyme
MLGRFLEYTVTARPLAASFEFYRSLGFASIPVGDTLPDPYVVLFDGSVAVGLHDRVGSAMQLTFVRPELRAYARALRRLDIELDYERLGDGEFNSVGFSDPAGNGVALVEARTFPPPEWDPHNVAACGELFELTLPAHELERSSRFWQALGFAPIAAEAAPHPWQRLAGHGVTIGIHEIQCRPGLSFRCADLDARCEYLRAKGLAPRNGSPLADRGQRSATLTAPEGTQLYLFEKGAQ